MKIIRYVTTALKPSSTFQQKKSTKFRSQEEIPSLVIKNYDQEVELLPLVPCLSPRSVISLRDSQSNLKITSNQKVTYPKNKSYLNQGLRVNA